MQRLKTCRYQNVLYTDRNIHRCLVVYDCCSQCTSELWKENNPSNTVALHCIAFLHSTAISDCIQSPLHTWKIYPVFTSSFSRKPCISHKYNSSLILLRLRLLLYSSFYPSPILPTSSSSSSPPPPPLYPIPPPSFYKRLTLMSILLYLSKISSDLTHPSSVCRYINSHIPDIYHSYTHARNINIFYVVKRGNAVQGPPVISIEMLFANACRNLIFLAICRPYSSSTV